MARGNTDNVLVGMPAVGGGLFVAKKRITDPTQYPDDSTDLVASEDFISVGFLSEDGVTETAERDTDKKKAWGGDTLRILQNEHNATFQFTLMEAGNADVQRLVYGADNVSVEADTGRTVIKTNSEVLPYNTYVIDVLDQGKVVRKVIPNAQITGVGDVSWTHQDVASYETTIEALPDSNGDKVITYIRKTAPSAPVDPETP